jgi:hypothetical protein
VAVGDVRNLPAETFLGDRTAHARHAPSATVGVDRVDWQVLQVVPGAIRTANRHRAPHPL